MITKHFLFIFCGLTLFLCSCKTYYIPVDSFKQQLSVASMLPLKQVATKGPYGDVVKYDIYPIDTIKCIDENGHMVLLKNSPSLEIRFTDNNNNKNTFYFDLISVHKDSVSGAKSRFITSIRKTIPLNMIKTIEIQDGKKRFTYVN